MRFIKIFFIIILFIPALVKSQCTVAVTSNPAALCQGTPVTFTAFATGTAPITYQWYFNNGKIATATKATYNNTAAGSYYVIIIDQTGCTATSATYTINTLPSPGFAIPPVSCANSSFNFSGTPNNMKAYNWTFGDGNTSNLQNASNVYSTGVGDGNKTFNVTLVVTDTNGCQNSVTQPVTVEQIPDASMSDVSLHIAVSGQFIHCLPLGANGTVIVNNTSTTTTNTNYTVNWGDGTANYSAATLPNGTSHTYATQGEYLITLTVTDAAGCTASKTYTYFYGSNPSGGFENPGNTYGCAPQTFTFPLTNYTNNSPGTTYTFSFCER